MRTEPITTEQLADRVLAAPMMGRRRLVALAGAPASGKSTLAEHLAKQLNKKGCKAQVVPMDGFHLHNPTLVERRLLNRKGAPETFDARGFVHLVRRLGGEDEVYYPIFDRRRDIAIAGGGFIDDACHTVIIEGNYLLYDAPIWRELNALWDLSIRLDVPIDTLKSRLVDRWLAHGLSLEQAKARADENDLINVRTIADAPLCADITFASF